MEYPEDFFEKRIRPILVRRCYACHSEGAKKLRGNLYLDSRRGWMVGGDSGPAIVPGEPDRSLVIQAVRYQDESLSMPPKGKLPPAEIAALELWVAAGAVDPRAGGAAPSRESAIDIAAARNEWPYTSPRKHPAPRVRDASWPIDPIDHFLLASLEEKGLEPTADADPYTLCRRIFYDLTGLPPSPEDIESFVRHWESSPLAAVDRTIEDLLASPRFGEHWGRKWLDLARYADTNGSDFNATFFNAWKYRDYVIGAFNSDRPYDRFVREQIAGDLLPADSDAERARGIVATGFLTLGAKMLSERDKEKLRMDIVDEQLDTVGKVFLGLSLGCARCHDHKFDPIPTTDYYALAGIFASTETIRGEIQKYVSDWVRRDLPIPGEQRAALQAYQDRHAELKQRLQEIEKRVEKVQQLIAAKKASSYPGVVVDDRDARQVGAWKTSTYTPRYVGVGYIHDNRQDKGKKSVTFTPDLPQAGMYEVRVAYASGNGRATNVPVTIVHAGGESTVEVDQVTRPPHDDLFDPVGRYRFEKGRAGRVSIGTAGTDGYVIVDAVQFIPVELLENVATPAAQADQPSAEKMRAAELYREQVEVERQLAELEKNPPRPVPGAMAVAEADDAGDCRLRVRGEPHNRGDVVRRGFLLACSPHDDAARLGDVAGSGRAEFARWLTRPDHPLTARVLVNRVWYHLLGEGIVRTVDNFGARGEPPTHPELLDTLAVEFVEDGWSIKRLVRRIVRSRAYRMASDPNPRAEAVDPENRLLWRAHRRRLPAEALRDSLLRLAGELDLDPSRAPVKTFKKLAVNNNDGSWSGAVEPALERKRSVYQPVVRGALPDILAVFDFADPSRSVGRRTVTTVPTQSLYLMNSAFVRECAAKAAARWPRGSRGVDRAYLSILGRPPTSAERRRALRYVEAETAAAPRSADGTMESRAWSRLVQALLASTEFRILN